MFFFYEVLYQLPELMGENLESTVLVVCTGQLERAFECDRDLAHHLNKEGYVKDDEYNEVTDPKSMLSKREKASILVSGIKKTVALKSQRYHDFLDYLKLYPRKYGDIADILDNVYGEYCKFYFVYAHKMVGSRYNHHLHYIIVMSLYLHIDRRGYRRGYPQ